MTNISGINAEKFLKGLEEDISQNILSLTIKTLQDKTKLIKANNTLGINYYGLKAFLNAK